ncbi:Sodium/calcium exchanger domain-containing protein [Trichoderma longibrachiatum]
MRKAFTDPDIGARANGLSNRPDTELRDLPPLNQHEHAAANTSTTTPNDQTNTRNGAARSTDAPSADEKPGRRSLKSAFAKKRARAPSAQDERQGPVVGTKEALANTSAPETAGTGTDNASGGDNKKKKRTFVEEFRRSFWLVLTHSWFNVLLVFVPVGIIVANVGNVNSGLVFAMNCIAVIPLAGLLSFATESVALKMGDALGALLNVTFGNAVELIIFIIALVKDEIRIVQASLLGSILANLLLILGMGFFLGGLRFREQVYNSTVTQMSACLLSLSVISLVLPTAFHASFSDPNLADHESLKISRGTSVILLLVYVIYLMFQLKSHAYLYESTPQNIVDAESVPGPAAAWLETSSSDSSSSESSDSDDSSHSRDTVRRAMRKVLRHGRRRKSSVASVETGELQPTRTSSFGTTTTSPQEESSEASVSRPQFPRLSSVETNEEAVEDDERHKHRKSSVRHMRKKYKKHRRHHRHRDADGDVQQTISEQPEQSQTRGGDGEPRRVDFAIQNAPAADSGNETSRRPFPGLRSMSVKNLAPPVFVQKPDVSPSLAAGPVPRVRYGIRRTNSLPDRLNHQMRPPGALFPAQVPLIALTASGLDEEEEGEHLTQTAAVVLLLLTTGLVAACAEFLIGSIQDVVATSSVGEIFIGLIVLPIVGNAAEHVTAVTVAMKNKMDLAIGVAIGSSIQIAIFVTPLVVILGWIMDKEMTLYFTLFETVCLFVSTFMVNFLVLDGRSNYLEGALLCAVYCIIGVVAFFYPDSADASSWGS